jgi:hypothetical protein
MAALGVVPAPGEAVALSTTGPLGAVLGDGAQGTVFELAAWPHLVFKRYHDDAGACLEPLRALTAFPQSLPPPERALLEASTAWPRNPVVNGRSCAGVLMPRVPARYYATLREGRRREQQFQHLVHPGQRLSDVGMRPPSDAERAEVCLRFAELVELLHCYGWVIGDISYTNGLWSLEGGQPSVYLVDCDGLRRRGFQGCLPSCESAFWEDPAYVGPATCTDSDRYKLGLLVYRVLVAQPFVTPTPATCQAASTALTPGLADLAARMAKAPAGQRPAAYEWCEALRQAMEDRRPRLPSAPAAPLASCAPLDTGDARTRPTVNLVPATTGTSGTPLPNARPVFPVGRPPPRGGPGRHRAQAWAMALLVVAVLSALTLLLHIPALGAVAASGAAVMMVARRHPGPGANVAHRCKP